ncbi:MFS transporter, partial [Thermobifida halotolerans]|uniref:MFS transporter n=1 Tax=Thermobifida halotolerans TaxID=483545 RepID=UPI001F3B7159
MRTRPEAGTVRRGSAGVNLALATAAFTLLFWAWNLIGPLAPAYSAELGLDPTQTSVLIACPVLVGSLGRIPAGALTDRYGGRVMLAGICFVTVVPVVLLGVFGTSYLLLLVFGFLLGIAGASFAVGVPFVNSWYAPERRGFATGLFGAGMGGTALSAFLTPYLAEAVGRVQTHLLMAAALAAMGVLVLAVCRTAPDRRAAPPP